jgi:2-polyprenyl-6-methoxyphenol hydroxylase-like FAD-dependent oxidoreductase
MSTALIVGGGVAGPVAGMALRRAGIDAIIFEAYPSGADEAGAFLTLQTNGIAALRTIDAHQCVADQGFPTPRMRFFSGSGKPLGVISNGGRLSDGTVSHTLRRSDLYRALRDEALRRGVRIEYAKRLVEARQTADRVTAAFADGTTADGDLLIGCDGIRSRVRQLIDPGAPSARYVPLLNIGGYAHGVSTPAKHGEYSMIFGRRAFFGYAQAPDGETWWFANPPCAEDPGAAIADITDAQWRERLHHLYSVDNSPAVELIRATPGPLRGWTTYDIPTVPRWHSGRMMIIGDAAHATSPSSGQGASMAIEDAVVLAMCLRGLPVTQAFMTYERLRRRRVERVVAAGARASDTKVAGPIRRVFRDQFMPVFLKKAAADGEESLAWMHQFQIDWNAPVTAAASGGGR